MIFTISELKKIIKNIINETTKFSREDVISLYNKNNKKRKPGAYAKQLFNKNADHNFLKSLIYVHWLSSSNIKNIANVSLKDELSANAYSEDLLSKKGNIRRFFGNKLGIVLEGRTTWLQSNDAFSGFGKDEKQNISGSGKNKQPQAHIERGEELGVDELMGLDMNDVILNKGEWRYNMGLVKDEKEFFNEAIIDNWSPKMVVVYSDKEYDISNAKKLANILSGKFNKKIKVISVK